MSLHLTFKNYDDWSPEYIAVSQPDWNLFSENSGSVVKTTKYPIVVFREVFSVQDPLSIVNTLYIKFTYDKNLRTAVCYLAENMLHDFYVSNDTSALHLALCRVAIKSVQHSLGEEIKLNGYQFEALERDTNKLVESLLYKPNYSTGGLISGVISGEIVTTNDNSVGTQSKGLPAMEMIVTTPCDCCVGSTSLWYMVQRLNDKCGWTREAVAEWIDKLHDDGIINAEFGGEQPENTVKNTGVERRVPRKARSLASQGHLYWIPLNAGGTPIDVLVPSSWKEVGHTSDHSAIKPKIKVVETTKKEKDHGNEDG